MTLIPSIDQYQHELINEYYDYYVRVENLKFPIKIEIINDGFVKKRYVDAYDCIGQYDSFDDLYNIFLSDDDLFVSRIHYIGMDGNLVELLIQYLRQLPTLDALNRINEIELKYGRIQVYYGLTREQIEEDIFGKDEYQRMIRWVTQ